MQQAGSVKTGSRLKQLPVTKWSAPDKLRFDHLRANVRSSFVVPVHVSSREGGQQFDRVEGAWVGELRGRARFVFGEIQFCRLPPSLLALLKGVQICALNLQFEI